MKKKQIHLKTSIGILVALLVFLYCPILAKGITVNNLNSSYVIANIDNQDSTITGTVRDDSDPPAPIPGVSIQLKGANRATVTNENGTFSLPAKVGDVLVFTSVGYVTREFTVGDQSPVSITLNQDLNTLEEVVLTGYSTQARKDITGAVAIVDVKELTKVQAPNVAQQLQGRAAGVTVTSNNSPGGEATVRVRGFGTINNNDPLYIIDGVPTKGGLNSINPNNIESMQVLKDASSTSIYGSRAANGVVIITTKKGTSGESRISFDSRVGVQTGKVNLGLIRNPQQFGDLLWTQLRNAGVLSNGNPSHPQFGNGPNAVVPDYILAGSNYGLFEGDPSVDPSRYSYDADNFYQIVRANKEGTDWHNEILRPALVQEYNLGATGGSDNGRYAVSLNYLNQDGVLDYTAFNRYSLRANTEFNVKKVVRFGENLELSYTENKGYYFNNGTASTANNQDGNPIGNGYRIPSIIPVYDIMGNFAATRAAGLGPATNPVAQLYRGRNNQANTLRAFGNVFAEADVFDGLTARTSLGFDYTNVNRVNYVLMDLEEAEIEAANSMTKANINDINLTWTNTLNYTKTFNEIHNVNVLAGTEAIKAFGEDFSGFRNTFFSEDPDYMFLNSGTANINNSGAGYEWALFSIFGKINYSLKDRYLLEATIRRDGSSRFGANNRYGTFPAFSGGWRVSEESFLSEVSWLDNLLIRAGWGQTGNQEIGNYNGFNTYRSTLNESSYAIDGSNNAVIPGFDSGAFGNPDAKWETTTQTNVGLDMTILQGRIGFNLDLYNRTTSDMLYQLTLPGTQGVATVPFVNVGEMNNKGFDFAVNYQDNTSGGFSYGISANISAYRNKVVRLSDEESTVLMGPDIRSYIWTRSTVDRPLYSFYGHVIDGFYQNEEDLANGPEYPGYAAVGKYKYRDLDGDGVITDNDRTFIGNPHPDFTYGLNINLGYKNFDLSAFFQGVQGADVLNMVKRWVDFNNQAGNRSLRMLNESWTPDNPNAVLPILDANDSRSQQPSSYFVEDGSYFRLKNLTLGYTFPESTLSKIGLERVRIYIQGQNLFTFTNYTGIDPEITSVGSTPGSTTLGVDQGNYPLSKMYQFGINVGF
ncbi:TonB-dependent receptor [Olivibacter sp. SDN3]|uniref:SusC/RagA family TonB-linked outer membrane protein n=1 Tax=Olivibacter sp. SDN3 TaxID=2764720 RepID=UPI0016519A81|nr:TonB-dependent receptor [Olivibacter sp. SDN3]QNL49142.1 TonB-dependent receptor [Olivibacter sp. SDN3]